MTAPEADVILACKKLISEMQTEPRLTWTREQGHQDRKEKKKYEDLKDDAQPNIDMDQECEEELRESKPLISARSVSYDINPAWTGRISSSTTSLKDTVVSPR